MPEQSPHLPVLYEVVLEGLALRPNGHYIDATVGAGGHAAGILAGSGPRGRVLGIDADPQAIAVARRRLAGFGDRVDLVQASFSELSAIASEQEMPKVDGILFDLGLSSMQLASPERGFSFRYDGPLDMRFGPSSPTTALSIVNDRREDELVDILRRYGQERRARRIAQAIIASRPLSSTLELARLVEGVVGRRGRIHPATRTFQAIRIAVNDELAALTQALPQAVDLLTARGRLVVLSFHSLEDRIVKQFMVSEARDCLCPPDIPVCICGHRARLSVITRRPIRPSQQDICSNPRCRSARLRTAAKRAD
jgi:16S rRNA (cytosine1402-N4)-methyltransferase